TAALPRVVAHLYQGGLIAYPTETVYGLGSRARGPDVLARSEEHTSELQSRFELVCRLLLEKKNDLAAGRIQCNETPSAIVRPLMQPGDVILLALTDSARAAGLRGVPTATTASSLVRALPCL